MEFGAFSVFDTYPALEGTRAHDRTRETFRLLDVAEVAGFDVFWVAEHHFGPGAALPAPPVWLAAAAQRTRRIRLGSLVAVLPLHDPGDLAEQYALVDRLSGGRLEIGVGSGYVPQEFRGFGRDPEQRRAVFDRVLPEFLAALRGEPGDRAEGAGSPRPALNVRPIQRPAPPIWRAAAHREAIRAVGRAGGRLALVPYATVNHLDELSERIAEYRAALPSSVAPRVLAALPVYAGFCIERADRALQRFLDSRAVPAGPEYAAHLARHPHGLRASALRENGLAIVGGPSVIRERVRELETCGVTHVAGLFDVGGLAVREAAASMLRFATWVGILPGEGSGPERRIAVGSISGRAPPSEPPAGRHRGGAPSRLPPPLEAVAPPGSGP